MAITDSGWVKSTATVAPGGDELVEVVADVEAGAPARGPARRRPPDDLGTHPPARTQHSHPIVTALIIPHRPRPTTGVGERRDQVDAPDRASTARPALAGVSQGERAVVLERADHRQRSAGAASTAAASRATSLERDRVDPGQQLVDAGQLAEWTGRREPSRLIREPVSSRPSTMEPLVWPLPAVELLGGQAVAADLVQRRDASARGPGRPCRQAARVGPEEPVVGEAGVERVDRVGQAAALADLLEQPRGHPPPSAVLRMFSG